MPNLLNITSLNVNYFRPNEVGLFADAFPEWRFEKRFPLIQKHVKKHIEKGSNIFAFQEIHPSHLKQMQAFLDTIGFQYTAVQYAPDPGAFYLLTAYNPEVYDCDSENEVLYYTESGQGTTFEERLALTKEEKIARHLGTEFEKCAMIVKLLHKESKEEYCVVNTHLGLDIPGLDLSQEEGRARSHRFLASQKLAEHLKDREEKLVIVGDFNSFVPGKALPSLFDEQIRIFTEAGFIWETEVLARKGSQSTFFAFPGDLGLIRSKLTDSEKDSLQVVMDKQNPLELRALLASLLMKESSDHGIDLRGGVLDQIFSKGMALEAERKVKTTTVIGESVIRRDKESEIAPQRFFAEYLRQEAPSEDLTAITSSDHYAVNFKVKL